MRQQPVLYIVIPCYNEEKVLPVTSEMFLEELLLLIGKGKIAPESRILFVNDGSSDSTWDLMCSLAARDEHFLGVSQSRNRGHQNAVLAGLMEAMDRCDITISIDCDGQDDISAMEDMVDDYAGGSEIVYGVRNDRTSDTFFKRYSAESFYRFLNSMGVDVVMNHADYRLLSNRVLHELARFEEVNLYLRGMVPLIGFKSSEVYYERHERLAGRSHYPLNRMISLALNGITSLSIKPLRLITMMGVVVSILSFLGALWAVVSQLRGNTVAGWASMTCIICLLGGIQLISLGVIGEYIGKMYLEVKHRPRYIISERTFDINEGNPDAGEKTYEKQ